MTDAICNTSPLLYLYRVGSLDWLPRLFTEIWVPNAVVIELRDGQRKGYDVPETNNYNWLHIVDPTVVPSEWLTLDLGLGEISVIALALENKGRIVLLDDAMVRQIAQAAGLEVWGTLRIILEAKSNGMIESIKPVLKLLIAAGMWISDDLQHRVLKLANEGSQ
jgi:hypothetical protein